MSSSLSSSNKEHVIVNKKDYETLEKEMEKRINELCKQLAWLSIFVPVLVYYIYSCTNNPYTSYTTTSMNTMMAANIQQQRYAKSILSHLQLQQSYQFVTNTVFYNNNNNNNNNSNNDNNQNQNQNLDKLKDIFQLQNPKSINNSNDNDNNETNKFHHDSQSPVQLLYPLEIILQSSSSSTNHDNNNNNNNNNNNVNNNNKYNFVDMAWKHDDELKRGYLLISDSTHSGFIWKWEVGGGPITIGRSLFMQQSGCRSNLWNFCSTTTTSTSSIPNTYTSTSTSTDTTMSSFQGSAGITIQSFKDSTDFQTGSLIVAELGEQRIVRMEQDGARTPLVITVPHTTSTRTSNKRRRISNPGKVLYSPFGDLIFTDTTTTTATTTTHNGSQEMNSLQSLPTTTTTTTTTTVYILKEIVNISPIPFHQSRKAHELNDIPILPKDHDSSSSSSTTTTTNTDEMNYDLNILFQMKGLEYVSGLEIGSDFNSLFIACRVKEYNDHDSELLDYNSNKHKIRHLIVSISLVEDNNELDDDEEDEEEGDEDDEQIENTKKKSNNHDSKYTLFYDMTDFFQIDEDQMRTNQHSSPHDTIGSSITIDKMGNVYATYPGGVAIIDSNQNLIGILPLQHSSSNHNNNNHNNDYSKEESNKKVIPVDITFGRDNYLYVLANESLMRVRIKSKPIEIPTDFIIPKKKKKGGGGY